MGEKRIAPNDPKTTILFRLSVVEAISCMKDESQSLEDVLVLLRGIFLFEVSKRREPEGEIIQFSVSLRNKKRFTQFRVKATKEFGLGGDLIAIDVFPRTE